MVETFPPLMPLCKCVCCWCNGSAACLAVHDDDDSENDYDDCGMGWPTTLRTDVNAA